MIERKPLQVLQRIYELRKSKGISLKQMAKAYGIESEAGASRIENGEVPLRVNNIYDVASLLDVDAWELFFDSSSSARATLKTNAIGPLSTEEILLVTNFRKIPSDTKRKATFDIVEAMIE